MARVEGAAKMVAELRRRRQSPTAVIVGYAAEYAIYVHEDLEAHHPVGQAKFLEQPYRTMKQQLMAGIAEDIRSGLTLEQALLRAGLKLQAASQKLTPVDTGALRNSAFTEVEK